ncbi:hypothetical protein Rs2_41354 [Raphanus sativus]|nr:hypothetical protein Rs2_41354 [Raphanus sativus]
MHKTATEQGTQTVEKGFTCNQSLNQEPYELSGTMKQFRSRATGSSIHSGCRDPDPNLKISSLPVEFLFDDDYVFCRFRAFGAFPISGQRKWSSSVAKIQPLFRQLKEAGSKTKHKQQCRSLASGIIQGMRNNLILQFWSEIRRLLAPSL